MLTFIVPSNAPQATFKGAHESPRAMSVPLVILAFGAIFDSMTSNWSQGRLPSYKPCNKIIVYVKEVVHVKEMVHEDYQKCTF